MYEIFREYLYVINNIGIDLVDDIEEIMLIVVIEFEFWVNIFEDKVDLEKLYVL